MIHFFGDVQHSVFAVQSTEEFSAETIAKLTWLFGQKPKIEQTTLKCSFVGPRAAMITPRSTNARRLYLQLFLSIIDCPLTRAKKVASLFLISSESNDSRSCLKSSAGEGNPAEIPVSK